MKDLKLHKSLDEQIELLAARGLEIHSPDRARVLLRRVNYYRLTGYLYQFRQTNEQFREGATLERIENLCRFDRKLTRILMYALEDIEQSLKTRISYEMTSRFPGDPEIFIRPVIFKAYDGYLDFLKHYYSLIDRHHKVPFVKHHIQEYGGRMPMWVAVEVMTMGNLSRLYTALEPRYQKVIARIYGTGLRQMINWIEELRKTRNHLAHYMRIYCYNFGRTPARRTDGIAQAPSTGKIFDQIQIMAYLYSDAQEWNEYIVPELKKLLDEYKNDVDLNDLGFPEQWEEYIRK